jgi:hypothetical protein
LQDNGNASVYSIVDLLALPEDGQQVVVDNYYANGTVSLCQVYRYNASGLKSTHNGGTIISPTVPFDGTTTGHAAFLAGTGETDGAGSGVWELQYGQAVTVQPVINPMWFGADIDDTTGDSGFAAFQAAINSVGIKSGKSVRPDGGVGAKIHVPSGQWYINGTLEILQDGIQIVGQGSSTTLRRVTNAPLFVIGNNADLYDSVEIYGYTTGSSTIRPTRVTFMDFQCRDSQADAPVFWAQYTQHYHMERVHCINTGGSSGSTGGLVVETCQFHYYKGCSFVGYSDYCFKYLLTDTDGGHFHIDMCTFSLGGDVDTYGQTSACILIAGYSNLGAQTTENSITNSHINKAAGSGTTVPYHGIRLVGYSLPGANDAARAQAAHAVDYFNDAIDDTVKCCVPNDISGNFFEQLSGRAFWQQTLDNSHIHGNTFFGNNDTRQWINCDKGLCVIGPNHFNTMWIDSSSPSRPGGSITAITQANPAVVTCVDHGFSTSDTVTIAGVKGMVEVNRLSDTVTVLTSDTFELDTTDSSAYTAYVSGGTVVEADGYEYAIDGSGGAVVINSQTTGSGFSQGLGFGSFMNNPQSSRVDVPALFSETQRITGELKINDGGTPISGEQLGNGNGVYGTLSGNVLTIDWSAIWHKQIEVVSLVPSWSTEWYISAINNTSMDITFSTAVPTNAWIRCMDIRRTI